MSVLGYIFFVCVAVLAVLMAVRELRLFKSSTAQSHLSYTRKRLRRRLTGVALLLLVSAMLCLYKPLGSILNSPEESIAYLGVCLIAMLVLFWLVVIDVREMGKTIIRNHQKITLESLDSLRRHIEERKGNHSKESKSEENQKDSQS